MGYYSSTTQSDEDIQYSSLNSDSRFMFIESNALYKQLSKELTEDTNSDVNIIANFALSYVELALTQIENDSLTPVDEILKKFTKEVLCKFQKSIALDEKSQIHKFNLVQLLATLIEEYSIELRGTGAIIQIYLHHKFELKEGQKNLNHFINKLKHGSKNEPNLHEIRETANLDKKNSINSNNIHKLAKEAALAPDSTATIIPTSKLHKKKPAKAKQIATVFFKKEKLYKENQSPNITRLSHATISLPIK